MLKFKIMRVPIDKYISIVLFDIRIIILYLLYIRNITMDNLKGNISDDYIKKIIKWISLNTNSKD